MPSCGLPLAEGLSHVMETIELGVLLHADWS